MQVPARPAPTGNRLLDQLPIEEFARLAPLLESQPLLSRQDLCLPGAPLRHAYFPSGAVVNLLVVMEDGREVEVSAVGREGVVGITAVLGLDLMPFRVGCQIPGGCVRLPVSAVPEALRQNPRFEAVLRRYAAVALRCAMQGTACLALHSVEARLCRWLLVTRQRVGADEFPMTQEALAMTLGVRRQTVSVIAGSLQSAGLIRYTRGVIRLQNPTALASAACECYAALDAIYEHALR